MTLQKKTLARYRQYYPHDTLREISARTGIQITRVFRLFNGKTMKVAELEAFDRVINEKLEASPEIHNFNAIMEKASIFLTNEELAKLVSQIERKITARSFSRSYIRRSYEDAIIA